MLVIIMAALALPLLAVILFVQGFLAPKPEPRAVEDEALRQALMQVSEKALPPATLETEIVAVSWSAPDLAGESRAVEDAAKALGGVAVTMEQSGELRRLVVQIPSDKATEFLSKFEKSDQNAAPKGTLQGSNAIFEITLRTSSP